MDLEEVLTVLLGWLGLEIEVSLHGANGSPPVAALEVQGQLRKGEEFGHESASPKSFAFVLDDGDGLQIAAAIHLYESSYAGGGWYDDDEEVLEIRSGVIQILIAPVEERVSGAVFSSRCK